MAASGDHAMRVVTKDDLRWPRWLKSLGRIGRAPAAGVSRFRRRPKSSAAGAPRPIGAGNTFITLYLLGGGRFPWSSLGREIRLCNTLRLLTGKIFR